MKAARSLCALLALLSVALAQERECECVDYWLCANGKIITDGTDLLDVRGKSCPGIEVCCLLDDGDNQPEPATSPKAPIDPVRPNPPSPPSPPIPPPQPPTGVPPSNPNELQPPTVAPGGGCGRVRYPPNTSNTVFKVTGSDGPPESTFYGEAPWMVVILEQGRTFKCGGTLITPSVVLTAAHCVQNYSVSDLTIKAGEFDNRIRNKPIPSQTKRVSKISIHPNFNPGNLHNDIAVVFLEEAVQSNPVVDVICAPEPGMEVITDACLVTGWGRNASDGKYQPVMSKVYLELRDRDYCIKSLRNSRLGTRFRLHEGFICAGGGDSRDTCTGDGGGPLACPLKSDPKRMVQVGVVAWGIGCGDGYPTVMTSVNYYLPWIRSQMS